MSARIRIPTPFINKTLLLKALENLKIHFIEQNNQIILSPYYINFVFTGTKFDFIGNRENASILEKIEKEYTKLIKLQEEVINKIKVLNNISDIEELKSLKSKAIALGLNEIVKKIDNLITQIQNEQIAKVQLEKLLQEKLKQEQEFIKLQKEQQEQEENVKKYIEETTKKIIENAKKQGYSIKQKKVGNKIKIILRRNV